MPPVTQVLAETAPLTNALFEYLPEGRRVALIYFEPRRLKPDETLLGCMVRYEVRLQLQEIGVPVEEENDGRVEGDDELGLQHAALLGLAGDYRGYRFRILKSPDGTLPPPGRSPVRRAFYAQQPSLFGYDEDRGPRPNIIFLWRFATGGIPEIFLAVPKAGANTKVSVKTHYEIEQIPFPTTTIVREEQGEFKMPAQEPQVTPKRVVESLSGGMATTRTDRPIS